MLIDNESKEDTRIVDNEGKSGSDFEKLMNVCKYLAVSTDTY